MKMSPGQARAFMREAARALAEAEKLVEQYGSDKKDGAVIRFRKQIHGPGPRPAEAFNSIMEARTPVPESTELSYAGVRTAGRWYLTGRTENGERSGLEWEDILEFLNAGIPVRPEDLEVLSEGYEEKKALTGEAEAVTGEAEKAPPDTGSRRAGPASKFSGYSAGGGQL